MFCLDTGVHTTADKMRPSDQVRELATIEPGASTDRLLHKLLANLASILKARRAYVTELIDESESRIIAAWEDNKRGAPRNYRIRGTPCAKVIEEGVHVVDCDLAKQYVFDELSLGYGCESFVGSPIIDHNGNRIGQLCVFGSQSLDDAEMASALVSMAAVRISAELEHRKHQELLRHERQKLEKLLGNLPGMAYRCEAGADRKMRFASEGSDTLTGYESSEFRNGRTRWLDLVHEDDRERVSLTVRNAITSRCGFEIQYRINTKDGRLKWVWDRATQVEDEDGHVRSIQGFISDATDLKESEAALARSEAYSSAIVATAAEGIITLDAQGRIQSFNRAAEKMFGYTAKEVLGVDVHVLIPDSHRGDHSRYVNDYIRTGSSTIIGSGREVLAQRKDGAVFPIFLAASEIDVDGEKCFTGMIRDISDQKAAEASIRAVERRFRAVFDQRIQLASILSVDGVVLEANQRSLAFAGLGRDAVIGKPYWDTAWWSHSNELQAQIRSAVQSASKGTSNRFETNSRRADGTLATLDFSVRPITGKDGKTVFLVTESYDITEHRQAEEEAKQHRARIAHVTRLSTLGEMAAGIAHEINQPLTAISLFAQAGSRLLESGNIDKLDEVCHKLNQHALRAGDVVERMQLMARQGESVKEVVDCNDLVESAVKLAESEARIRDTQVKFERGVGLPPISVDVVQIQQVALNLIRNGMEAMLVTSTCSDRTVYVETDLSDEGGVQVSVSDGGCGIRAEHIDKLFTPFSTTKKSGMGMGLSISQAIVRAHGGHIDFRNNKCCGATFWFTLPAAMRETQDDERADCIRC